MKKINPAALVLVIHLFFLSVLSQENTGWIKESIDLSINTEFAKAESLLTHQIAESNSSIEACFYYASVLSSKMTHFENSNDAENFLSVLQNVIDKCDSRLEDPDLPAKEKGRLHFYRGSAYGYKGFFEGQNSHWFKALNHGLKSIGSLEKAVELDSTLYEAYLGIGVYQYWRSTKLKFILWTPFFDDLRQEGITNIKKAVRYSKQSRYTAIHQLVYILLNEKQYHEALTFAKEAVAAYPHSQFMQWAYAHVFFKMRDNHTALKEYDRLMELLQADPNVNPSHIITCHLRKARIYLRLEDYEQCADECRFGLNVVYDETLSDKGREARKNLQEMISEIESDM